MRWLDLIHRWTGGCIGLLLAALGLTGTLLLYEDAWLRAVVPHAAELPLRDDASLDTAAAHLMANASPRPASVIFPTHRLSLFRLSLEDGGGAYADASGGIMERWSSKWDRPELWLFDFHHHLLLGEAGAVAGGVLGLIGLGFVFTGFVLWWRYRRAFAPRLVPARFSRFHVNRHHRDLGVLTSPFLVVTLLTGAMLTLRPVADFLLSSLSPAGTIAESLAPPPVKGGPLAADFDWQAALMTVRNAYPRAEIRTIAIPAAEGQLIRIRVRQDDEWLPNGRTVFWFDPADGRLIEARDAHALPLATRAFNLVYPIHASTIGGVVYKAGMTIAGLSLTMLGTLAVFGFWSFKSGRACAAATARRAAMRGRPAP